MPQVLGFIKTSHNLLIMSFTKALCVAACALVLSLASSVAQVPPRSPMGNPPPVTGVWRLAGADTGMLAFLEITVVETGTPSGTIGGRHANGSWSALNQGCPAKPECQFRGAAVGSSGGGVVMLKLVPSLPGGIGASLTATRVAADSLVGFLSLQSGGELLNSPLVALVRVKP